MKYILIIFVSLGLFSCTGGKSYRKNSGMVWNTTYNIIYNSDKELDDTVRTILRKVELSLSPFNKASLITAINNNTTDSADAYIETIFAASREINMKSGGSFDPTLAPLINAYGFGFESKDGVLPTDSEIDSALALVGIADCRIENGRMSKKHPGTLFNFSAITKGFGVDEVARAFERNGVDDYLVEIGGEIRVKGRNPDGKIWRIQIDAPIDEEGVPSHTGMTVLEKTDVAVATSGNYRNNRKTGDGKKIGHTISPVTGRPVQGEYVSVTVFAPECMSADGWATAIMAGAPADSLPESFSAILVDTTGRIIRKGFRDYPIL